MKKLICLVCALAAFGFMSCSSDDSDSSSAMANVKTGFGVTLNSDLSTGYTRLVSLKSGKVYENFIYDVPSKTAGLFPINLYEDKELTKVWFSSNGKKDYLYYNADNVTFSKLSKIFGHKSKVSRSLAREEIPADNPLYIRGDFNTDFAAMTYADNVYEYAFTYRNDMGNWGHGNGNLAFKFLSAANWDDGINFGGSQIFETGVEYESTPASSQNICISGLVDGNNYKVVVTYYSKNSIVFSLEGELGADSLKKGLQLRGSITNWEYDYVNQNEDGTYYYEFLYSDALDNMANQRYIVTGNDRYKNAVYFSILPANVYFLGSYADKGDGGSGELAATDVHAGDSRNTTFTYTEAKNFVFGNLEIGKSYRIDISKPKGSWIKDIVYTVTFSEVTSD